MTHPHPHVLGSQTLPASQQAAKTAAGRAIKTAAPLVYLGEGRVP